MVILVLDYVYIDGLYEDISVAEDEEDIDFLKMIKMIGMLIRQ